MNIGRILYYSPAEISTTYGTIDNGIANAITSSMFETFLLPGETRIQVSFMLEINNTAGTVNSQNFVLAHYISTGSLYTVNNAISLYEVYTSEDIINTSNLGATSATQYSSGVLNLNFSTNQISYRQGMYCRIYSIIYRNTAAPEPSATIKLKNFVYRSSRAVGSSTVPIPQGPILE